MLLHQADFVVDSVVELVVDATVGFVVDFIDYAAESVVDWAVVFLVFDW